MTFELFIARRYLASRRKPFFASLLLWISLLAVSLGVFALVFVLAVMNGFENDFRERVQGFKAPLTVTSPSGEDLSGRGADWGSWDHRIRRLVPFAEGEAVLQTETGGTAGVRVRGIVGPLETGRLEKLYESEPFAGGSAVLGEELAATLRLHPDFLEKIRLIFPLGDVGPTGEMLPRIRTLTLTGLFRSGFYEYDSKYAVVPYEEALRLFGPEARTGMEVWVEPFGAVEEVKKILEERLSSSDLKVQTWRDQNPKLFAALKLEKIGMFLLLTALLLIASFTIFGLSSLTVLDKVRDMAVLRSVGLTATRVRRIFLAKAAGIGIAGGVIGGGLGLLLTLFLQRYPVRLPSSYYIHTLPLLLEPVEVLLVLIFAPLLTLLSALYPAFQAGRGSPVEVLRYE